MNDSMVTVKTESLLQETLGKGIYYRLLLNLLGNKRVSDSLKIMMPLLYSSLEKVTAYFFYLLHFQRC